jgi:hypothetical protein
MAVGAPELDAATAEAVADEVMRASRHALPIGTPCANCQTPLAGPWCHACGQKGEDYHRSIWRLTGEAFEGFFEVDSRIWNTLPKLFFRPGRLTRAYLDGHRATQIPPFRMFLIALVLVFFAGGLSFGRGPAKVKVATPDQAVQAVQAIGKSGELSDQDKADMKDAMAQLSQVQKTYEGSAYVRERVEHAVKNPQAYVAALQEWGHRFAVLMLPISAVLLSVIFVLKRGVYVFDHLIFSMHSLSAQGLLFTAIFLGSLLTDWVWWLVLATPVHLFFHMRATYRISTFGTLIRMWLLFWGSAIAVGVLLVALMIVGAVAAR